MAKRKSSTGSALGLIVATGLVLAGHAVAQQPTVPPQVPTTDPQQAITPPSAPTATPVFLPPAVAPSSGTSPAQPVLPSVPVPVNGPGPLPQQPFSIPQIQFSGPQVQRFNFKINPNAPIKDLLPTPPTSKPATGPVLADDLIKVPEAEFQARPGKVAADGKQAELIAHQLAKINHVNAKKTDAFMTALLENRTDLAGLPFAMGDDCRTSVERTKQFTQAVATVRQALSTPVNAVLTTINTGTANAVLVSHPNNGNAPAFWSQYRNLCDQEDMTLSRADKMKTEQITLARIAALMQMMAPETPELRLGLVKYLTGIPHVEATKALARMAIFSAEDEIRFAAIDSLKVRKEKDYTDIFLKGLRYPWPAVAKRSADAIARLDRADLIPELVAMLASDDPRLPSVKTTDGKQIASVREMVKINHHRNCMMCHAPGNPGNVSANAITAEVPVQGQPLPLPFEGYRQSSPDLMIRVDVTYLRQDFSAMLPVEDAHPWPDLQRFDFFVRERKLSSEEADVYKVKLTAKEEGVLSPYHKAALAALRELTGKDTEPTAEAWRKLLKLPTPTAVKID
jgi:hypothetical protein